MADEVDPKKPRVAKLVKPPTTGGDYDVVEDKPKVVAQYDRDEEDDDDDDRPRNRRRRRRDDDEEETGDATGGLIPYKNAMALLAYYFGIFGFFLPIIGGIIPVILGFKGLSYAKQHPKARGQVHAIIGIIAGSFSTLFWLGIFSIVVIGMMNKR
ncbi:MAG: DUF4190 domain-containing protein [Gemmataceae bacterium]